MAMFNPDYVLPGFLFVCAVGLVAWNVRLAGITYKLEKDLDNSLDDIDEYQKKVEALTVGAELQDTVIRGYQRDVDTLREERRIQEQKLERCLAAEAEYIQKILDLEKTVKEFTGMINTLNNKIPKRDESGKFKKKK